MSIPVLLVFGVDRDYRLTVDQGIARTAADILGLDGVLNAAAVSTALRMLVAYDRENGETLGSPNRVSNADIREALEANPSIVEDVQFVVGRRVPFLIGSQAAFALHVFKRYHREDAMNYMNAVLTGEGLHRGDPAHTVRNRLIGGVRVTRTEALLILFRGFAAVRERRAMMAVTSKGKLPKLT